jgi:hypothetical protein
MTGIASPEDGIGRVIIGSAAIALVVRASSNSAIAEAMPENKLRRSISCVWLT